MFRGGLQRQDESAATGRVADCRRLGRAPPRLLERLQDADAFGWWRAAFGSASLQQKRDPATGPNSLDRGKPGTRRHLVADARVTPPSLTLGGANCHDSRMLAATLDAASGVRSGRRGCPWRRPDKLHADKGYDHHHCRRACQARSMGPRIARRGIERSERLGRYRWIVERTLAWLARFRRFTSATSSAPTCISPSTRSPSP